MKFILPTQFFLVPTGTSTNQEVLSFAEAVVLDSADSIVNNKIGQKCQYRAYNKDIDNVLDKPDALEVKPFHGLQRFDNMKIEGDRANTDETLLFELSSDFSSEDNIIGKLEELVSSQEQKIESIRNEIEEADPYNFELISVDQEKATENCATWSEAVKQSSFTLPPKTVFVDLRNQFEVDKALTEESEMVSFTVSKRLGNNARIRMHRISFW